MPPRRHATMDFTKLVADKAAIQRRNPHRDHMYHLDGVIYCDFEKQRVVGYKDVRGDEFWVSGHMPGYPLFPGVIMCEAVAIYGVIMAIILQGKMNKTEMYDDNYPELVFAGYALFWTGITVGFSNLACG